MSMRSRRELCRNWKLYVISSPPPAGRSLESVLERALLGGASVVQLRDKTASDEELLAQTKKILAVTRRHRVPLIVNDRPGVALAGGADGLHLGQEDGPLDEARRLLGEHALIGRSTHTIEQALEAEREGFDYIGVGPVYATPTKPGRQAVGLEFVRSASEKLKMPFVAIGGIDETNIAEVSASGAKAVAVVRAVMNAPDPEKTAKNLLKAIQKGEV